MNKVILQIRDEVNCRFIGLPLDIRRHFYNSSKIFNPALRFTPAVRLGRWDGKTPYFAMGGDTYINLLGPMIEYLAEKGFDIELEDLRTYNRDFEFDSIDNDYLSNYVWPPSHPMAGQPIRLRDHQTEAVNVFLQQQQGIASLPTASGKSLVTAILSKKIEKYGRSLVIVPNKDLITQTEEYYNILGLSVGVYYGDRKEIFGKKHLICTWQSLEKLRQSPIDMGEGTIVTFDNLIDNVQAVIVDECQGLRGSVLKDLMCGPLAKVPIRWAVTGTVPKEAHEVVNLTIAIGNVVHKLASSELQELGILSNCDVKIIQMIDTREFTSYAAEYSYLIGDIGRIEFVAKLIENAAKTGNVLVLVGRKGTGKTLESLIDGSIFLSGDTKSSTRRDHYDEVAISNSKVIIATAGIAAVGIDIPRLNHLFVFEAGKSYVRTIQAVGRSLRTAFDKNHASVWDICSSCRFSKRHLTQRKKWYSEQKFPFTIEKVVW